MNLEGIKKAELKSLIKEILLEDFSIFKELIKEILAENQIITSDEQAQRRAKIEAMINDDFDKYDEVFQQLTK